MQGEISLLPASACQRRDRIGQNMQAGVNVKSSIRATFCEAIFPVTTTYKPVEQAFNTKVMCWAFYLNDVKVLILCHTAHESGFGAMLAICVYHMFPQLNRFYMFPV